MKSFLLYLIPLIIFSCTNSKKSNNDKIATKDDKYLKDDLPFMAKADSICRTIDAKSIFEHIKDETITDRDGQRYPAQYKGYSKSSSESVDKFLVNVRFGGKNSAKTTFYYYNCDVIKAITEIFADDTVKSAFYYDGDKMIYPQEAGREEQWEETAAKVRNQSATWKTFFPPSK
jgi:guanyl-specific ribonuclease Sa